jgi:hypothetical protein
MLPAADSTVTIAFLPPRPQALSPADLGTVFGGCRGHHEPCEKDKDCCDDGADLSCVASGGSSTCMKPTSWG